MNNKIKDVPNKNVTIKNISNVIYYHTGSQNHGCEALVRTIIV